MTTMTKLLQPPSSGRAGGSRRRQDAEVADLPEWDLDDLYRGIAAPEIDADLAKARADAEAFRRSYEGTLATLSAEGLAAAILAYERIQEALGRLTSYAQLKHATAVTDPEVGKFFQTVNERVTEVGTATLFFALELNRIDESALERKLADPALARWRPWLRDVRTFQPHQLSDDLEKLLHEKHVAGRGAWTRLFDQTVAALRFPLEGRDMTSAEVLNLLSDKNRERRKSAGKALGKVLGDNIRLFALVTNTLAKDKEIEDKWRSYPRPISRRNLENYLEDDVVQALHAAVVEAYPRLSHRYYRIKARWLGLDKMAYWDRNAPLPSADERVISWSEARDTVLGAYASFSPALADTGRRFFENAWIDAPLKPGKSPGAFAHPTVPSAHPYLLLNYQGKVRDVMTLAHELGHGVHQVLAARQGYLLADTPLTLAETASVFGEMLTFRAMLARETDVARRKVMLASKIEDMLNTVVRQIAMCRFEQCLHDERRGGELTAERIGALWLQTQSECLGPAFALDEEYQHFWAYIPHFVHVPFYVYAYAFGDCLVNSLYAVYEGAADGFAQKYMAMLQAGGTLRHRELLAPFGLDASDPAFWAKGLGVVERFIAEIETMA
ncbi:MAG: M3 family oligoendopeptidase [Alphaproteobacteria bacterium]|nr:M3 family oligoendopeptidase [Alphaproteobacteria bacterium]